MKAFLLDQLGTVQPESRPLRLAELPIQEPGADEVLIQVNVCGVCHTELDEIEGRTVPPRLPAILGHQIVGHIAALGKDVHQHQVGDRVAVAWIGGACGRCEYCAGGLENLCPEFQATGRDRAGGYTEYTTARAAFVYPLPQSLTDIQAAPLLCAGAIGYRSLRLTNLTDGQQLGLIGFGASAHLVLKLANCLLPNSEVYVLARSEKERAFALELGAVWAGDISEAPPKKLRAVIDTTPAWIPPMAALCHLVPGGRLVINAIRKEEQDKSALLEINYAGQLWMEKEIKSVANVTRQDVREFLELAATAKLEPRIEKYPFVKANEAILDLKYKPITGAKVLIVSQ